MYLKGLKMMVVDGECVQYKSKETTNLSVHIDSKESVNVVTPNSRIVVIDVDTVRIYDETDSEVCRYDII